MLLFIPRGKKRSLRWHLQICPFISPNKLMCLKTLTKTPFALRNDSPPRCLVIPKRQQLHHPLLTVFRDIKRIGGSHQSVFIFEGMWIIRTLVMIKTIERRKGDIREQESAVLRSQARDGWPWPANSGQNKGGVCSICYTRACKTSNASPADSTVLRCVGTRGEGRDGVECVGMSDTMWQRSLTHHHQGGRGSAAGVQPEMWCINLLQLHVLRWCRCNFSIWEMRT